MNLIELVDLKVVPDIYHKYNAQIKSEETPLVIDNGSYKCRVGWGNCKKPLLEFRNLIAKPRKDRKKEATSETIPVIQIGNDIVNIEAVRMQLKSQFDRNVVTHFHNQEQILDYIFSHLSIDHDGSVPHPIVLTEALGNPNYCRQQMNELLFECYGVPSLTYGIDAMFSWQNNKLPIKDALIISFGFHTTHIIPVLDGSMKLEHARRLNIGGYHINTYLFRLMQMKYPVHLNSITISRMEWLMHKHSFIVKSYEDELRRWADGNYYADNVKKIQLPYTAPQQSNSNLTPEQRLEKRKELARRLIESNMRRAKEKLVEDEQLLEVLYNVRGFHEHGEHKKFTAALKENKLSSLQALDKLIATVAQRSERCKLKLETPIEVSLNNAKVKAPVIPKPPEEVSIEDWVNDIRYKRDKIMKNKQTRKTRRQDIAKRHTAAAQERMRIISQLARNEKGTDEFGMDDKDWDVYKVISRHNDTDSESENEHLLDYDNILRHHDPNYDEQSVLLNGPEVTAENYQLHVGAEATRAPELLFQPSMIGSSEGGLAELIAYVLHLFNASDQLRLATNVFMTGGCAQFPGLKDRLSKELLEMRPFRSPHNIKLAKLPELDAWLGANEFANSADLSDYLTSKKEYEEKGQEYFKSTYASNIYVHTPIKQTAES